jgi:hypothetical protein
VVIPLSTERTAPLANAAVWLEKSNTRSPRTGRWRGAALARPLLPKVATTAAAAKRADIRQMMALPVRHISRPLLLYAQSSTTLTDQLPTVGDGSIRSGSEGSRQPGRRNGTVDRASRGLSTTECPGPTCIASDEAAAHELPGGANGARVVPSSFAEARAGVSLCSPGRQSLRTGRRRAVAVARRLATSVGCGRTHPTGLGAGCPSSSTSESAGSRSSRRWASHLPLLPADFGPNRLQRVLPDQLGLRRFFTVGCRPSASTPSRRSA